MESEPIQLPTQELLNLSLNRTNQLLSENQHVMHCSKHRSACQSLQLGVWDVRSPLSVEPNSCKNLTTSSAVHELMGFDELETEEWLDTTEDHWMSLTSALGGHRYRFCQKKGRELLLPASFWIWQPRSPPADSFASKRKFNSVCQS